MDHTTSINVFLVVIVVLFIGGLILIARRGGKTDQDLPKPSDKNTRRPY